MLAACDGGSSNAPSSGAGGIVGTPAPSAPPVAVFTEADAVRLAKQASFGPSRELVARIHSMGAAAWIDAQLALKTSSYSDMAANAVRRDFCNGSTDGNCSALNFSRNPVAMRFYSDAVIGEDQLRQRVAFALGQLIVASETEVNTTAGIAAFNQIFLDHAFGNYRDILQAVTMHGYMGDYLDMADSNKSAPSENYAREMLQLFSMGPDQLNMDGTPKLDATGARLPNYTAEDLRGVARALTGWTYARVGGAAITDGNARDHSRPMIAVASRYDTNEKRFLGVTVPAGATQEASVKAVVDAAFDNASTAPHVSRFLIQSLVTPNPTPAYVQRVAQVFANNGTGVRGDLKAVVRAILLDTEARSGSGEGKLKEPVLLMTSLARAIGFTTDGQAFLNRDNGMGQPVFRAPSVFNFFPPDYPLPGSTVLKSPASKLVTTTNVLRWHNFVYDWTISGDATRGEFAASTTLPMASGTQPNWAPWEALGTDTDAMIARIDLLMMASTMTDAQKAALKTAATAITNTDPAVQARRRAQTMLYIVASSPLFLVDR